MRERLNLAHAIWLVALLCVALLFIVLAFVFPETTREWLVGIIGLLVLETIVQLFIWPHWFSKVKAELIELNREWIAQQSRAVLEVSDLASSARSAGIAKVYPDRQAAKRDILDVLASCNEQVRVLGVTCSRDITINEMLESLSREPMRPQ